MQIYRNVVQCDRYTKKSKRAFGGEVDQTPNKIGT